MSRLLSEEQIKQIRLLPENENNTYSEMMVAVAKDQLTKTDEEWIKWAFELCDKHPKVFSYDPTYRKDCTECWEEREKDLGNV